MSHASRRARRARCLLAPSTTGLLRKIVYVVGAGGCRVVGEGRDGRAEPGRGGAGSATRGGGAASPLVQAHAPTPKPRGRAGRGRPRRGACGKALARASGRARPRRKVVRPGAQSAPAKQGMWSVAVRQLIKSSLLVHASTTQLALPLKVVREASSCDMAMRTRPLTAGASGRAGRRGLCCLRYHVCKSLVHANGGAFAPPCPCRLPVQALEPRPQADTTAPKAFVGAHACPRRRRAATCTGAPG
jgi:hypothetical protein